MSLLLGFVSMTDVLHYRLTIPLYFDLLLSIIYSLWKFLNGDAPGLMQLQWYVQSCFCSYSIKFLHLIGHQVG